ncbi:hypothetical protein NPIL_307001 [Nephila pilipes]|uniref:Uncharacterized protein n=1 Tax=Nephila pilipes TaxID=299642 RepID=A0A8X6MMT3_NEPPI|nr:hypothetical protein NPIL_307001 [Nephila pilipes]
MDCRTFSNLPAILQAVAAAIEVFDIRSMSESTGRFITKLNRTWESHVSRNFLVDSTVQTQHIVGNLPLAVFELFEDENNES